MFVCIPRRSGVLVLVEESGQEKRSTFSADGDCNSASRNAIPASPTPLVLSSLIYSSTPSRFSFVFFLSYYSITGTRYGGCAHHRPRLIRYSPRAVTAILITSYRSISQPPSIDNGGRRRNCWFWQWRRVSGSIMEVRIPLSVLSCDGWFSDRGIDRGGKSLVIRARPVGLAV